MGWYYRLPQAFPAMYPQIIRLAVSLLNVPQLLTYGTPKEVASIAETLRWFRWCVKQDPTAFKEFYNIFESYDIRASTQTEIWHGEFQTLLYITAKPTKVSEFIRLNPEIAGDVLPECQ